MYFTKANTALMREIEKKILMVAESCTYGEIVLTDGDESDEFLFPFRCFEKEKTTVKCSLVGEKSLNADAEIASMAINMMLALEIEHFGVNFGHSAIVKDLKGEASVLEELDLDEADDLMALCDMLDGFGLSKFVMVDLNQTEKADGIFFTVSANGFDRLLVGKRIEDRIELMCDLEKLASLKKGNTELKEPVTVVLVASDLAETAYKVTFGLRQQGLKTECFISGGSMIAAEEYCDLKGIPTLVWAGENQVVMKNIQSGETAETTLEKLLGKKS